MRGGRLVLALSLLCATALPGARLQAQAPARAHRFPADSTPWSPPAALAGLMSAAVPGAGEYSLHLDRWVPRVALEAFAWWEFRQHRREARTFQTRYRALSCQVARRIVPGECRDSSDFEYYEQMGKRRWTSSGSFDRDPVTPGVQPETDTSTFNGKQWEEAQLLHGPGSALIFYTRTAIPPAYLWNWGDNTLEQTVYDELIRRSDDAFRTSSRLLGLILANHVTSAVDAFIAARLRELARAPAIEVRSGFVPDGGEGVRWKAGISIPVGGR